MPTYTTPSFDFTETSWNLETTDAVKKLTNAVGKTDIKNEALKYKIDDLEDKVHYIEATGTVFHTDCPRSKRFFGLHPQPTRENITYLGEVRKLKEKLMVANKELVKFRNLTYQLQNNLKQAQRLLISEIGYDINLSSPTLKLENFGGWKGRAQLIIALQQQLEEVRNKLENTKDVGFYNTIRKPKLVPKGQKDLMTIKLNKAFQFNQQVDELSKLKTQVKELNTTCKAFAARNDTLSKQLKDAKDKFKTVSNKSKEDSELIRCLMGHQKTLQNIINNELGAVKEEFIRNQEFIDFMSLNFMDQDEDEREPNEFFNKESDEFFNEVSIETYKTLKITGEDDAKLLENTIYKLYNRLEMVVLQVVEAEKHCCEHELKIKNMEALFNELRKTGVVNVRLPTPHAKDKKEHVNCMVTKEKLKTKNKENLLLRNFLTDILKSKTDDFIIYRANLEATKKEYLTSLAKMKKFLPKKKEKEEDEETEED